MQAVVVDRQTTQIGQEVQVALEAVVGVVPAIV
jgi:hypothetical protein